MSLKLWFTQRTAFWMLPCQEIMIWLVTSQNVSMNQNKIDASLPMLLLGSGFHRIHRKKNIFFSSKFSNTQFETRTCIWIFFLSFLYFFLNLFSCLLVHLFSSDFSFCSFFPALFSEVARLLEHQRRRNLGEDCKTGMPQTEGGWDELREQGRLVLQEVLGMVTALSHFTQSAFVLILPEFWDFKMQSVRERIKNKEGEKVEILPKSTLKQQFPRPPYCLMKWEGELEA